MRRTLIAASLLTVFLAAALAPIAIADEEGPDAKESREEKREREDREAREDRKEERRELKEDRKEERRELKEERKDAKEERKAKHDVRFARENVSLDLSGTMLGKDNATYTFEMTAEGKGIHRVDKEGNETKFRYHARLMAHVVVMDENGTIVKESDVRVRLYARGHGDEVKWILSSVAKKENGMPKLSLKGEADQVAPGLFELEGKGRAVFKLDGAERATPVKIPEVSGTFAREIPAAPAAEPGPIQETSTS